MQSITKILLLPLLALSSTAAPVKTASSKRAVSTCPSYTIISTRGSAEPQGPSAGFRTMNSRITSQRPGGKIHNTVYPADLLTQDSSGGTKDIIDKITSTLQSSPDECFVLQGYSQGATATVNALPGITGAGFDAVKGVFLIGDPEHKSGMACNVDNHGGTTTRNVDGVFAGVTSGIPEIWVNKTLDVCIFGDGICDTTHNILVSLQHLAYPFDPATQDLGTSFTLRQLGA